MVGLCGYTHLGGIRNFPRIKFVCIFYVEQKIGVLGGGGRIEQSFAGVFKIMRCDWVPIGPEDIVTQAVCVDFPVFGDLPSFGNRRDRLHIGIILGESFHDIRQNIKRDAVCSQRPVKGWGFVANRHAKHLTVV